MHQITHYDINIVYIAASVFTYKCIIFVATGKHVEMKENLIDTATITKHELLKEESQETVNYASKQFFAYVSANSRQGRKQAKKLTKASKNTLAIVVDDI